MNLNSTREITFLCIGTTQEGTRQDHGARDTEPYQNHFHHSEEGDSDQGIVIDGNEVEKESNTKSCYREEEDRDEQS
jgi:hypothetical protein